MSLQEWIGSLRGSLGELAARFQQSLPAFAAALVLLLVGWLVGRVLRRWSIQLIDGLSRRFALPSLSVESRRPDVERRASEVVGSFVFWVVFVVFLGVASDVLGVPVLATWLDGLTRFVPQLFVAVLIVLAGVLIGRLARETVAAAWQAGGLAHGDAMGRGAQVAVVVAAGVTAVDQIGIDSRFLTSALIVTIAAALGGAALAFGLGGRTAVSNIVAVHYVRQTYRVGQIVRLDGLQGRIREITSTAVVLDAADGRVLVPANTFAERVSTLVTAEG